mgnify:FL=1
MAIYLFFLPHFLLVSWAFLVKSFSFVLAFHSFSPLFVVCVLGVCVLGVWCSLCTLLVWCSLIQYSCARACRWWSSVIVHRLVLVDSVYLCSSLSFVVVRRSSFVIWCLVFGARVCVIGFGVHVWYPVFIIWFMGSSLVFIARYHFPLLLWDSSVLTRACVYHNCYHLPLLLLRSYHDCNRLTLLISPN